MTRLSRRNFLLPLLAVPALPQNQTGQRYFTIVNHWHQAGIGLYLPRGQMRGRQYQSAYSIFYAVQKTIDAVEQFRPLVIGLEFDSFAYEAIHEEDPDFVNRKMKPYVTSGEIEINGGTYAQPYSQLVGWQSNVRQLVEGRATVRRLFGKEVDCFLVEEIIFHPQMPQLLKLSGFRYASLQSQNNGRNRPIAKSIIRWRGLDGSELPTIPANAALISLAKQYKDYSEELSKLSHLDSPLITLWAETWPPGLDWGASYTPYEKGIQSFRKNGVHPIGVEEYMRRRCTSAAQFDSEYLAMDDATFSFGWPQNARSLWGKIGGWGYQGDRLLQADRQVEHQLKAAEFLMALAPQGEHTETLARLWKKFMVSQNHDFFIVAGFPAEYNQVVTTNFEAVLMMHREVLEGLGRIRQAVTASLANPGAKKALVCQNATFRSGLNPVNFEPGSQQSASFALSDGKKQYACQRAWPNPEDEKPRYVALVPLPAFSVSVFSIEPGAAATRAPANGGEIRNEFHFVSWDATRQGFLIRDQKRNTSLLFRPFTGEITRVKETFWEAPNTGEKFRAKNFREVGFRHGGAVSGPVFSALQVKGDILGLNTTADPAAWATCRAVLYRGLSRVDIHAELNTNPQMAFLTLAEIEVEAAEVKVFRDFPFGEEASHNPQFHALHYVRLESPGQHILLAHDGTQQFFLERRGSVVVLRNMIARETMKGSYQWRWSLTSAPSVSPAESLRFSQCLFTPIVEIAAGPRGASVSLAADDPALVVFRYARQAGKALVWVANYSGEKREASLKLMQRCRSARRVNFEGAPLPGPPITISREGTELRLSFAPWEIVAVELSV